MIASPAPEEEAARYTSIAATSAVIWKVSAIPMCDEGEEHDKGGEKRKRKGRRRKDGRKRGEGGEIEGEGDRGQGRGRGSRKG